MSENITEEKAAVSAKPNTIIVEENFKNINEPEEHAPWLGSYGEVPFHLEYPQGSMCDAVFASADKYPDQPALSFMGANISYSVLRSRIIETAHAFSAAGVKAGDRVTVCMPNVPQTVYCMYALIKIGAVAVMIHPLSAEGEIVTYVSETDSRLLVTLDQFFPKLAAVQAQIPGLRLLITSVAHALNPLKAIGYKLTVGRKDPSVRDSAGVLTWKTFLAAGKSCGDECFAQRGPQDVAVILFSGGTTGVTKGIQLSNLNFNALAIQTATMCHKELVGSSMLAAMPMFHGFGLGVCVHTMLTVGGRSILVPRFTPKQYAELIAKERPNYIAGVPTLYEAISSNPYLDGVKLDCLRGVFSGGDSLSIELKKKFDAFLADHGATIRVREGYGTTECVTASCLTPYCIEKEGSIGLPFPDTYYMICLAGTTKEAPYGTDGEICLRGPSVMVGYLGHEEENANTLQVHEDGHVWLHTGDLGMMDEQGFIYFRQRIKRMIITSGYNVYPSQLENIIDAIEEVQMSCVIGVPDPYKMQKIKAFIMLKNGYEETEELREKIKAHCRKHIARYALPYAYEFRSELPKTLVGKIAYTQLEKEEREKLEKETGENG